jgi:hypothetical protein
MFEAAGNLRFEYEAPMICWVAQAPRLDALEGNRATQFGILGNVDFA